MTTKTQAPIFKIQTDYEVIGHGELITSPCQMGDWWVMPLADYKGKIPADIQQNMVEFQKTHAILGFLIADDMRAIEQERKKKEDLKIAFKKGLGVLATILSVIGKIIYYTFLVMFYLIMAALSVDPMVIAVMPSGEYVCLGSWFE